MSAFDFGRKYRLSKKKDFESLRDKSNKLSSTFFIAYSNQSIKPESSIAFSVSKFFGNAVKRNKLKRHLRESFRHSTKLKMKGLKILIVLKKSSKIKIEQLEEIIIDYNNLLKKINY